MTDRKTVHLFPRELAEDYLARNGFESFARLPTKLAMHAGAESVEHAASPEGPGGPMLADMMALAAAAAQGHVVRLSFTCGDSELALEIK